MRNMMHVMCMINIKDGLALGKLYKDAMQVLLSVAENET